MTLSIFPSFEYDGDGGITGSSFSGSRAYQLNQGNNIVIPANHTSLHAEIYVWATSSNVFVNGNGAVSTGKTKGAWTLYKFDYTGDWEVVEPIVISGTALIDQLIVMPKGSEFQGNVYDATNKVIATVNDQIETNFYDYDPFGRLTIVRDEQGNILKSTTYQYQAAQ